MCRSGVQFPMGLKAISLRDAGWMAGMAGAAAGIGEDGEDGGEMEGDCEDGVGDV